MRRDAPVTGRQCRAPGARSLVAPERMELSMLRMSLAAIGLLLALGLGACDEQVTPPQEPAPGAIPPAE